MQTTSILLSWRISRKSVTPRAGLRAPGSPFGPRLLAATAFSRCGWYTSHTATTSTFGCFMANPRFDEPMRPIPMKAADTRSFAPLTAPVKICVVNAAVVVLRKSLRSVIRSHLITNESNKLKHVPHDVHHLAGDHDDLCDLLIFQERADFFIG